MTADERELLVGPFEANRSHLRAVAYRMLGSLSEAEDAVQETWLRLSRSDTSTVDNLSGWLTTVVARVCLDMLRSRKARTAQAIDVRAHEQHAHREASVDPETEAAMADSVGLALLVLLDTLDAAERLAFVLHDMFDLAFEDIAEIVGRTPAAARQLASRARRRVQGAPTVSADELAGQREVVATFLAALRGGDVAALLDVLDPGFVIRADATVARGKATESRGAREWAKQAVQFGHLARFSHAAIVDGRVGLIAAPSGQPFRVLSFRFVDGKVAEIDVIADAAALEQIEIGVLGAVGE